MMKYITFLKLSNSKITLKLTYILLFFILFFKYKKKKKKKKDCFE